MYYVYVLHNSLRNKIYIGQSNNPETRLKRHNKELAYKKSAYTALNDGVWKIIYREHYSTRNEALKREKQLKSQKGREFIWNLIKNKHNR